MNHQNKHQITQDFPIKSMTQLHNDDVFRNSKLHGKNTKLSESIQIPNVPDPDFNFQIFVEKFMEILKNNQEYNRLVLEDCRFSQNSVDLSPKISSDEMSANESNIDRFSSSNPFNRCKNQSNQSRKSSDTEQILNFGEVDFIQSDSKRNDVGNQNRVHFDLSDEESSLAEENGFFSIMKSLNFSLATISQSINAIAGQFESAVSELSSVQLKRRKLSHPRFPNGNTTFQLKEKLGNFADIPGSATRLENSHTGSATRSGNSQPGSATGSGNSQPGSATEMRNVQPDSATGMGISKNSSNQMKIRRPKFQNVKNSKNSIKNHNNSNVPHNNSASSDEELEEISEFSDNYEDSQYSANYQRDSSNKISKNIRKIERIFSDDSDLSDILELYKCHYKAKKIKRKKISKRNNSESQKHVSFAIKNDDIGNNPKGKAESRCKFSDVSEKWDQIGLNSIISELSLNFCSIKSSHEEITNRLNVLEKNSLEIKKKNPEDGNDKPVRGVGNESQIPPNDNMKQSTRISKPKISNNNKSKKFTKSTTSNETNEDEKFIENKK